MPSGRSRKILIFFMLGLFTASAFFVRLHNFKKDSLRSIDEIVYYRMAKQVLEEGLAGYHTMPYGKEMVDSERTLPSYFFKPLFKHPPVYTFLLALSMRLFGMTFLSAGYVSLLFGALIIPVTFLIGKELFNPKIGLAAAAFIWLDPVNVMTSQKVWLDTTMNFFMLCALLFFIRGINLKRSGYFLAGGLACGLAMLTKYTGVLVLVTVCLVAFVHRRGLFRNKGFVASLVLPFVMLLPWAYWNFRVYGWDFIWLQFAFHRNYRLVRLFYLLPFLGVVFGILGWVLRRLGDRFAGNVRSVAPGTEGLSKKKVNIALGFFLLGCVYQSLAQSLQLYYLPRTSWTDATFKLDPPVFYVAQLIEFSFFYFFAFAALFIERKDALLERAMLKYAAVVFFLFFTAWRCFQCRYVLFVIPLLAILGAELIFTVFRKIEGMDRFLPRMVLRNAFALLILYALARTIYVDMFLSFTNDMCYY